MGARGRVPALDGIRGLAILAVLGYHNGVVSGGTRGVTVFFVLSGYLITRLLVAERDQLGDVSLRGFYLRRAARLGPCLVVGASVLAVTLALSNPPGWVAWRWAVVMLEGGNLVETFAGPNTMGQFSAYWSLATEEQFYLLWPGLLVVLLARGRRHVAAVLAVTVLVVSVARLAVIGAGHLDHVYFAPWFRFDALAVGCLVALLPAVRARWWAAAPALVFLLWLILDVEGLGPAYVALGQPATIAATAVLLVHGPALGPVLGNRPLTHVGRVSYGLYVWHVAVAPLWLAVIIAEVSWWVMERPIIGWAHRRTARRRPPVDAVPDRSRRADARA